MESFSERPVVSRTNNVLMSDIPKDDDRKTAALSNFSYDPDNTLAGGLSGMSPCEAIALGINLCAAVEAGFGSTNCHGTIFPGNITLTGGLPFLGPPRQIDEKEPDADILEFSSPEQFWNGKSLPSSDVYAIGLILYTALNGGEMPFYDGKDPTAETRASAMQKRMRGFEPPLPRQAGRQLGEIVLKALSFRRENRYSQPSELRKALQSLPDDATIPATVPAVVPRIHLTEEVQTQQPPKKRFGFFGFGKK